MDFSNMTGEVADVLKNISKQSATSISTAADIPKVTRLPFGMLEMDAATNGGIPYNRISIFWGIEGSGKGNLAYNNIRESQRLNPRKVTVFIDAEGTFDPEWAAKFGINLEMLIVFKPETGEDAVDAIIAFLKAEEVDLVVVDSLPALITTRELERSVDTAEVGGNALLIKRLMVKAVAVLSHEEGRGHKIALVCINQVRLKIGQMHGNPEDMPCGKAPKFFSSLIIKLYAKDVYDKAINADKAAFRDTNVTITKSKVLVNARTTTYKMALIETDDTPVGRCDSWNAANNYLKSFGYIEKSKSGYLLYLSGKDSEPVEYDRLMDIKDSYRADPEFAHLLNSLIFKEMSGSATLVKAKEESDSPEPAKVFLKFGKGNSSDE